jgi:hypothetical protein
MVQSEFNLVNWFVSYNIFLQLKTVGPVQDSLPSLTHACFSLLCFHPVNGLPATKYEGRASVADDDGVAAAAEIYSIPTATSTAGICQMPLQAPVRPV